MRSLPYNNKFPKLLESNFIAPNSSIIGEVLTKKLSSIYFGAVLRGDNCTIKIGKNSVIQDNTIITSSNQNDKEVYIGDNVIIGNNCYIDGAKIQDNVFIGHNASIYPGTVIETGAFIAPGTVLVENSNIPKNQIWIGNPGKYLRDITSEEREHLLENHSEILELSSILVEETEKTQQEILADTYFQIDSNLLTPDEKSILYKNMVSFQVEENKDEFGLEASSEGYHEIDEQGLYRHNLYKILKEDNFDVKFEQDLRHYPDYFKIYSENYKRYDEILKRENNIYNEEPRNSFEVNRLKPERPGAMRAWVSKWDSDFNVTFKGVGSKVASNNN